MKKIFLWLWLVVFSTSIFANTLTLKSGWNLVGINGQLSLSQMQTQLGNDNLLVVQGDDKVYKKAYVDANQQALNDFTSLDVAKGYWLKLANAGTLTYTPISSTSNNFTMNLKAGWNLISAPTAMSLSEIKQQISSDNLLVIQGTKDTYQKYYVDMKKEFLNDFTGFSVGSGYWIKVKNDVALDFVFTVDKKALDNQSQESSSTIKIAGSEYTVKILSSTTPTQETSQGTLAIYGTINGISLNSIKLNDTYAIGTNFIIQIFNESGNKVAESERIRYSTNPINFGDIRFSTSSTSNNPSNIYLYGVNAFGDKLSFEEYKLASITDAEFNALTPQNQRIVANKLLSALFYGLPKEKLDEMINSSKFISTIKEKVNTPNSDVSKVEESIKKLSYDSWNKANSNRELILARLFYMDLGQAYINRLSSYILAQSILFSPATEVATADASDIATVYNSFVRYMDNGYSMQIMSYLYMMSDENWERFRSPEDNGREMLEIFLLDFDDSNVPKAAIALKDWRLDTTDRELIIGLNQNTVPQELFGTTVTNGFDFYREIVNNSNFTKAIATRLVNMYFSEFTSEQKNEIISSIVASNPTHFNDIILQIIFSKEFLYNSSRVKSIEETFYGISKRLSFYPSINYFYNMRRNMDSMNQSPLKYKLGRDKIIPTDTLSFANYYSFIRGDVLVNGKTNSIDEYDSGWQYAFMGKSVAGTDTLNGLLEHIFLSVVDRKPTTQEKEMLSDYIINKSRGYSNMDLDNNRYDTTIIVLEYLARLSEVYTYQKIK
ncbi:MAG: hypothetical protein KN64_03530 [Sulfurovum sp. AS07-7]|nr:MAG: hypothetical protein KN64_03530 [Sulfurovum sp. AS07-7]